jgi:hypothetical protein
MRPKTATGVLALAIVLSICLSGWAAPAPSDEQTAKAKLEALEKKLPDLLTENVDQSEYWANPYKGSVRAVRMTGPTSAKLTVRLEHFAKNENGGVVKAPRLDEVLVIYMSYYDGVWTTQRYEGTWTDDTYLKANSRGVKFLMAALDEMAAK